MHLALWYVVHVCHQYDVCENYVGSVYIGGYGGLNERGLCVFRKLCQVECVACVCVWLGAGWEDWVWALQILDDQGECGICVCVLVAVVWAVLRGSGLASWARVWEGGVVLSLCLL